MVKSTSLKKIFYDGKRGDVVAVDGLSFECRPGTIFGLLGRNGAGKTTTLRMLSTILVPTSGTATVDGFDIVQSPEKVRERIGFLSGDTKLYDRLSGRETLAYFGRLAGLGREGVSRRIEELSQQFSLADVLDVRVGKMSTGMKQKISVARVIIHNPQVLILDEPTLGLDVVNARSTFDLIRRWRSEGKTIIFSTHIMSEAERLCDELGIDTISTGSLIGALIEGYEKGILTLRDLDGEPVTWGDQDAILGLIHKIAHREGIGDTLADGSRRVVERWPEMAKVVLAVKGLEQSAYDSRAGVSMALAYATSDIGAHHTRAWTIAKEIELGKNWSDEEKVDLVIYHQTLRPLFDMLGVCRLPWIELGLNEEHYARFYSSVTGKETTLRDLLRLSNDVYTLTRLINARLGMSRKDDTMPYKVFNNPIRSGPTAGKVIDREHFERMLDLYYQKRGWDSNGIPPAGAEAAFGAT